MRYVIPLIFLLVILYAVKKRVRVYPAFTRGVKSAVDFTLGLLPLIVCVFIMCEIFEASHLSDKISAMLSPLFGLLGIPPQLAKLALIKPFSGSGSLSMLGSVIKTYGADSYIARCACVMYGSSETVFYISAVYFSKCANKKRLLPVAIILLSSLISAAVACLLCRIM